MDNHVKIYKDGIVEGWVSSLGNIFLFSIKLWAGIVSGSIALIADAWHSLTDTLSSVLILVGLKYASKPADKKHPYGHGRAELIVSIIIGILLVLVGFHFIEESVGRLKDTRSAEFGTMALVVTILSILFKEAMAQYAFSVARRTGIESVRGDAWHHRSDALSSVVILLGILFKDLAWWIDGFMGIIVALLIFYFAFTILFSSMDKFLGRQPDPGLIAEIRDIAGKLSDEDLRLHHFHLHEYGLHNELTFHIVLPDDMKLEDASRITGELYVQIKRDLNIISTIHIDTESKY